MIPFTHLHVHSQYFILDGAASVKGLIAKAKGDNLIAFVESVGEVLTHPKISDLIKAVIAKTGENIKVLEFSRLTI